MKSLAEQIRADFPVLGKQVNGQPLVYLDSASAALKPRQVVEAVGRYYREMPANVHRGVHSLSREATFAYEGARETVREFLNAARLEEIVFTSGTTAAINLVARSWGDSQLHVGDEIILSQMEHHSNIVPWKMLCDTRGVTLKVIPVTDSGELDMAVFRSLLGPRTKLVAVAHVSNVLGTVNPVGEIIAAAHDQGARVLIDAAQSAPCLPLDVRALDCDFLAFSGHKVFGPTGIGVLYAKADLLEGMPPFLGGGDMILSVSFEEIIYNKPPYRFEAGTPDIAGAIGLGCAIEYVKTIGLDAIRAHEQSLLKEASAALLAIEGLKLIGTAPDKAAVLSFVIEGVHPHDIGSILDSCGVAIRTGHHCAQPLMSRFGLPATARASFSIYNQSDDIGRLVSAIYKVREIML